MSRGTRRDCYPPLPALPEHIPAPGIQARRTILPGMPMSSKLTPYRAASLPLFRHLMPDKEADAIRLQCRSGSEYEFGKLMMLNPPTDDQRSKLDKRHREIAASLSTHDQREIAAAVADLISCYRNFIKNGEDPKKVIAKYVKELHGIPTWACVRACTSIRNGEVKSISMEYPFSTMQLRVHAESYVKRLRDEAREISETMLGGKLKPPAPPEVRAKLEKNLHRLAFRLRSNIEQDRRDFVKPIMDQQNKYQNDSIVRDYARRGETPHVTNGVLISPQLLDQLKGVRNADGGATEATQDMEASQKQDRWRS